MWRPGTCQAASSGDPFLYWMSNKDQKPRNNQLCGDKSQTHKVLFGFSRVLAPPSLSVSPPPHGGRSGRVSGGRPQAPWRGEPRVHLSPPFMCSTEALSLFLDHSTTKGLTSHRGGDPAGLAATLLPILPWGRLGSNLREQRCRLDWALTNRDVCSRTRKVQNIRLSVSAWVTEFSVVGL